MEKLSRKGALWTPEELAILAEDRRNKVPAKLTADRLERPLHSVRAIGLLHTGVVVQVHRAATPEVDAVITSMVHAGATDPQIAQATGRTVGSVRHRIEALKLVRVRVKAAPDLAPMQKAKVKKGKSQVAKSRPRFSPSDIAYIRTRAGKDSAAEIGLALGRSEGSIFSKASALEISLDLPRERKISREVFAAAFAENADSKVLADRFGVHKATISRLAREYALVKVRKRRSFDGEARKVIVDLASTMTVTQVAHATCWDIRTVKRIADEESLVFLEPSRKPVARPRIPRPAAPKPVRAIGQFRRKAPQQITVVPQPIARELEKQADAIISTARPAARKAPEMLAREMVDRPIGKLASKPGVASKLAGNPVRRDSQPISRPTETPRGGNTKTLSMIAQIAQRMKSEGRLPRQ